MADRAPNLEPLLKAAYPKVVATLIRLLGDVDRAEDAASEAVLKALATWPAGEIPLNTVAWLVTAARRFDLDQIRHRQVQERHGDNVRDFARPSDVERDEPQVLEDDLLRLVFACCHPSLTEQTQVLLTLKVVLGFEVDVLARRFLLKKKTVEQRITRAKKRLGEMQGLEMPRSHELGQRLRAVHRVIYLAFTQGYSEPELSRDQQTDLVEHAIRLGRMMARLFRREPETRSLLALMLLTASRDDARVDANGVHVPLQEQDRSLWSQALIKEGLALIDAVFVSRPMPGPYQLQAAISALHCRAASAAETDWSQIAGLYAKLVEYEPSSVVRLNWAIALAFAGDTRGAEREPGDLYRNR